MDPIVAVLRSNFWLTIHVMTISVSYAAFTVAMLIGNFALIRNSSERPGPSSTEDLFTSLIASSSSAFFS